MPLLEHPTVCRTCNGSGLVCDTAAVAAAAHDQRRALHNLAGVTLVSALENLQL